jgi:hypothetical protein
MSLKVGDIVRCDFYDSLDYEGCYVNGREYIVTDVAQCTDEGFYRIKTICRIGGHKNGWDSEFFTKVSECSELERIIYNLD